MKSALKDYHFVFVVKEAATIAIALGKSVYHAATPACSSYFGETLEWVIKWYINSCLIYQCIITVGRCEFEHLKIIGLQLISGQEVEAANTSIFIPKTVYCLMSEISVDVIVFFALIYYIPCINFFIPFNYCMI